LIAFFEIQCRLEGKGTELTSDGDSFANEPCPNSISVELTPNSTADDEVRNCAIPVKEKK
jgi:hypothetical protein